jgi:hypothetical protein
MDTPVESPMGARLSRSFSGWVDRTGLSDTVLVAGSYEVTPPWLGWWAGPTGQYEDSTWWCVSRLLGQAPPKVVMQLGEGV